MEQRRQSGGQCRMARSLTQFSFNVDLAYLSNLNVTLIKNTLLLLSTDLLTKTFQPHDISPKII